MLKSIQNKYMSKTPIELCKNFLLWIIIFYKIYNQFSTKKENFKKKKCFWANLKSCIITCCRMGNNLILYWLTRVSQVYKLYKVFQSLLYV